jgi:hypothetical protein
MSDVACTNPQFQSPLNRASKDKFYMVLNLPYILRERSKTDPLLDIETLQISVFGTLVPNISVPATELRYHGQSVNVSSHSRPNYSPLSLSFVVDNSYRNYYVLWKWLDLLNSATESTYGGSSQEELSEKQIITSGSESEYQTTLSIVALDEYNEPSIEFIYTHCFITNLGGINYSYRDNEFIETTAEFQFNQLKIKDPKKYPEN